jgi:hypothetical protein
MLISGCNFQQKNQHYFSPHEKIEVKKALLLSMIPNYQYICNTRTGNSLIPADLILKFNPNKKGMLVDLTNNKKS